MAGVKRKACAKYNIFLNFLEGNAGKKMVPKPGFEPGQAYTH